MALLTRRGLKPLGRHETPLSQEGLAALEALGLESALVDRLTGDSIPVRQTIFSRHTALIQIYSRAFAGTSVALDPAGGRLEGFLFGFPSCCIEAYIREPYAPNSLPSEDQEVLYHWACPGCSITPLLLPAYRSAWEAAAGP